MSRFARAIFDAIPWPGKLARAIAASDALRSKRSEMIEAQNAELRRMIAHFTVGKTGEM